MDLNPDSSNTPAAPGMSRRVTMPDAVAPAAEDREAAQRHFRPARDAAEAIFELAATQEGAAAFVTPMGCDVAWLFDVARQSTAAGPCRSSDKRRAVADPTYALTGPMSAAAAADVPLDMPLDMRLDGSRHLHRSLRALGTATPKRDERLVKAVNYLVARATSIAGPGFDDHRRLGSTTCH